MNKPKILYFDIETTQMKARVFQVGYNQTIMWDQIELDSEGAARKVICISYKWAHERRTHSLQWERNVEDYTWIDSASYGQKDKWLTQTTHFDKQMLTDFNEIAKEADILIAHNGKGFDIKELRTNMALRNCPEPWCETACIDTLQDWRRVFRFPCGNKLDAVLYQLGIRQKDKMVRSDWTAVEDGDTKALAKMVKYCKNDTRLLEKAHKRLERFVPDTMMNANLKRMTDHSLVMICNYCASKNVIKHGTRMVKQEVVQRYMCKKCNRTS